MVREKKKVGEEFQAKLAQRQKEINDADAANQNADGGSSLEQIENDFVDNKEDVIQMLIQNVMNVDIEIPKVVKGDFGEGEI